MVISLRKSTRRTARGSSPATKSTNSTRSATVRHIPATEPPIPVNIATNPAHIAQTSSFVAPDPFSSNRDGEIFNFDGIQYSPYFLTGSDNPGASIIPEVLDGTNYNSWSIAITTALDAKNKLPFVDGTLPRPPISHPHYRVWSRCNSMVKSWLLASVNKQIYGSILRFNDASEIWKDLLKRFHITNLPRSYHITQQIWSLQQGSTDLSTYYTKLKTLWDDFDGADCVKTCQNCNCCRAIATKTEQSKIIKFLAGLNESYSHARSQIIMKKQIPDLAEIYNLLDQDYNQRSITPVQNASVFHIAIPELISATATPSINATYNTQKPTRPICSHCGYTGHTIDKCYKIHGYPPGFKHKTNVTKTVTTTPSSGKPVVAQLALNEFNTNEYNTNGQPPPLSQNQIQSVIAYFNSQLTTPLDQTVMPSTSGGIITALPGSYQGIDDWTG